MSAMQPWQPWQPNLPMNPQWGSPVGNWSQPIRPMFMQPQMGCQPIVPIYQQIVSPPAQVVVQREHRSHLEGFLLAGVLFMLGRGLRELSRQSTDQSGEPPAPVSRLSTLLGTPHSEAPAVRRNSPRTNSSRAVFGDGMVHVGVDMAPGTYRCDGVRGEKVYWARMKDASGETRSTIASYFGSAPNYVTLKAGEFFRSESSGGWSLVYLDN